MTVFTSAELDAPVTRVWAIIGDFANLKRWHPMVQSCDVLGDGVGAVRTVHFADWWAIERLDRLDALGHSLAYSITDSSRPEVIGVVGSITLVPLSADRTRIEWTSGHLPDHPDAATVNAGLESYYPIRIGHLRDALDEADRPDGRGKEAMKIGISIPNNWGVEDACRLIDLAVRAEDRGLASLWVSEHLINVSYVRARIGDRPYYHPLSVLSAIAARTRRIALGTSVIVLPFHNPFDLAKYVATLDHISRGRVILGVGVGNVPEEFETLGIPWDQRGALTDETIDIMRALWTGQAAEHHGRAWSFADVHSAPKPFEGRRLPIWVGGMSAAARRRAARAGEGWHPTAVSADDLRDQVAELSAMLPSYSRDPASMEVAMRFNIALDDMPITKAEALSTVQGYDGARILEVARSFQAAGVTHLIYALNGHDPSVLEATVDALARDLLPHFP